MAESPDFVNFFLASLKGFGNGCRILFLFFIFILFLWGKEGKCIMHRDARAPCVGLQYGLLLGSSARWTICRLTYPLKTSPAGCLGYIPLSKVDCRVWVSIDIDKISVTPE